MKTKQEKVFDADPLETDLAEMKVVQSRPDDIVPLLSSIMDRYEPPVSEEEYIRAMISHFMALKDRREE